MVKCICIDDTEKPRLIPQDKWVEEGKEYTVIFTTWVLPQKQLAFALEEIDLDESCLPYEYFLAERFAFHEDDMQSLHDLIEESAALADSVNELMEQVNLMA